MKRPFGIPVGLFVLLLLGVAALPVILQSRSPRVSFPMLANGSVPALTKLSFIKDPERGLVAPVAKAYATFMGHPLAVVVDRGGFSFHAVSNEEINRANQALAVLPNCIRRAEDELRKYAEGDVANGDDIQDPTVWISDEAEGPSDWSLVVEMKDNDGLGWHIEFEGEKFKSVWAG